MRKRHSSSSGAFHTIARTASHLMGSPALFVVAVVLVIAWLITGPLFNFSNTWQLIINTATTIITFLMVFLIQNTQNRDAQAMHLKLDELIRGMKGARNAFIDLDRLSDEELEQLQRSLLRLANRKRRNVSRTS